MSDSLLKLPKELYTSEQVRLLDSIAISQFGHTGFELMHVAADSAMKAALARWPDTDFVRVFAGSGNNAGDGFLCAMLAFEAGLACEVLLVGDPAKLSEDAKSAYAQAVKAEVPMVPFSEYIAADSPEYGHCIEVDALLGIGLDRKVSGDYARAIEGINASAHPVVAIDIPSGLCANTGMPLPKAVVADLTVTFIAMKQGLLTGQGRDHCGEIEFSDLGLPTQVYQCTDAPKAFVSRIDTSLLPKNLAPRKPSSHKGSNGHVVVVGGDTDYGGAIILSAQAAFRGGAGLVSVVSRSCHRPAALARCPELMWLGTEDLQQHGAAGENQLDAKLSALLSRATAVVLGPGLGRNKWSHTLFNQVISSCKAKRTPLVIDADGLYWLGDRLSGGGTSTSNWLLTPHPGEAAALLNISIQQVQQNRFAAVQQLSQLVGGSCLLKGSGSLISHGSAPHKIQLCSEGNPGMGTGGMGDLLAGLIGALIGQGLSLETALSCGVCVHGEAGDMAASDAGERGLLASDLLPYIRQLVNPSLLPSQCKP